MRRALILWGGALAAVLLLLGGFSILGGLGVSWDLFGLQQRRLERAEARAEAGEREALSRRLETTGAAEQAVRLDIFHETRTAAVRATATAVEQARSADDADTPLEPSRADRLRGHDRQLCRLAPDLFGCADPSGAAGDGAAPVRPADPAEQADPG